MDLSYMFAKVLDEIHQFENALRRVTSTYQVDITTATPPDVQARIKFRLVNTSSDHKDVC